MPSSEEPGLRGYAHIACGVLIVLSCCAHAARPNNPYGVMLMCDGGDATDGLLMHCRLARNMVGEWGYVRTGSPVDPTEAASYARLYAVLRALHLIPVCTAYRPPASYYDPANPDLPKRDPDGSFTSFAKAFEDWARALYEKGATIPYFEFGNEVNGGYIGDHPEVYAEMCIAVSKALKRVDPSISFGTAGMAGCADDFYDRMLEKVPQAAEHIDHWGLHPYAANHPPGYALKFDKYGLEGHLYTAEALAKHGIKNPVFIMTETGYELGNHRDDRFPKITEQLRADYLVAGYKNCWTKDPRVRGVMIFVLQDTKWSGWNGWDLVREDYSHTPAYDALAALPKPKGSDYLPSGPCCVQGRVVDRELGCGVRDVIVWMWRPYKGGYAAVTDSDGRYRIANVPAGEYTITALRDGFESASDRLLRLTGSRPVSCDFKVGCVGLMVLSDGGPGDQIAAGWSPTDKSGAYCIDARVKRSGASSQRIDAKGGSAGIWNITGYVSCLPNAEYSAEVWVRTSGLRSGAGRRGAAVKMSMTDSFAREISSAEVALGKDGDCEWTPLQVVMKTPPKARRIRIELICDADSGSVWFDDLFLGESSRPLPSTYKQRNVARTKSIKGAVLGPGGRSRVQNAVVWAVPTGRWALTDYLGEFEISELPEGAYRLFAASVGFDSGCAENVRAGSEGVYVELKQKAAPEALVNGDFEDIPSHPSWFGGWQRYGTVEGIVANGWHKGLIPEAFPDGFQAHSGRGFYGAVAGSNIKDGMIYQTIAVEPDALYEVSVWSMTYQTDDGRRGDVANRLGVDPTGGSDPTSPYVIWSPVRPSHGKWTQIKLPVRPVGNRLTVYLHHLQVHGITFNCNFFDDCRVEKVGPPAKTLDSGE